MFSKSAAIGFLIGYFLIGIGFFPVERIGLYETFIWLDLGLAGAILIGVIIGMIKYKNLDYVKDYMYGGKNGKR